jgi:hypothetical protein
MAHGIDGIDCYYDGGVVSKVDTGTDCPSPVPFVMRYVEPRPLPISPRLPRTLTFAELRKVAGAFYDNFKQDGYRDVVIDRHDCLYADGPVSETDSEIRWDMRLFGTLTGGNRYLTNDAAVAVAREMVQDAYRILNREMTDKD